MYKITSTVHTNNSYGHAERKVLVNGHPHGADTIVSEDELAHLNTDQVFALHKKNGYITIVPLAAETEAEKEADEMLIGSSSQPASFELEDGTVMSLGDVVCKAFTDSGMKIAAWNKQKDDTREKKIQKVVDGLPLKKEA